MIFVYNTFRNLKGLDMNYRNILYTGLLLEIVISSLNLGIGDFSCEANTGFIFKPIKSFAVLSLISSAIQLIFLRLFVICIKNGTMRESTFIQIRENPFVLGLIGVYICHIIIIFIGLYALLTTKCDTFANISINAKIEFIIYVTITLYINFYILKFKKYNFEIATYPLLLNDCTTKSLYPPLV